MEYGYSNMGYEVNGALGAKLAKPESEVYTFCGDGSFLMGHSELYTALQENLKINVCLFDNLGWGCIENLQNNQGTDTFGTVFRARNPKTGMLDGDEIGVDFAKIAEGYGAKGYTVRTSDELRAALEDAKKQTKSVVFDIHERVLISSINVTSSTGSNEIQSGKTLQLVATINPSNADDQTLTWESSNTSIATVSSSGLVTAKTVSENKTVTIKAISKYDSSVFGSIELTIQPKSSSVLPSNMVGTYSISSSIEDWVAGTLTLNADGSGEIISDFGGGYNFEYVSTSGNDYYFKDTYEHQLIVNFDGTSITSVTYYDEDGIFYYGSPVVFDVIS